jgi:hypothetical protein
VLLPELSLFRVVVRYGHSWSENLVEARSPQEASEIANPYNDARSVDVTLIELLGTPGIRWSEEESPDSPREAD